MLVPARGSRYAREGGLERGRARSREVLDWATLVGHGGHRSMGHAVCACLG
jgi:hypothetical protein